MFIILVYQATIFDKMLIAGASSITARGAIEKFGQVDVLWSQWFLAYLPCDIIVMFVAWRLALWLYPPENGEPARGGRLPARRAAQDGSVVDAELKSAAADADRHRAVDYRLRPSHPGAHDRHGRRVAGDHAGVGVLDTKDVKTINFLPIFFVAAAVSLSNVLVQTKALDVITGALFNGWSRTSTGG